jgi:MSHA pilin protein MshA
MKNNNQKGFTLVELIIVIVILGVLAVTAAPKFLDVKSDAIGGTLDGVKTAMVGVINIEKSRTIITTGSETEPGVVAVGNGLDLDASWSVIYNSDPAVTATPPTEVRIYPSGQAGAANTAFPAVTTAGTTAGENCYVGYTGGGIANISVDKNCG